MKVEVGNLYRSKGGPDTYFWLVVSLKTTKNSERAIVLGLDKEMNIVSGATYGSYAFTHRLCVGKVDISKVRFMI